MSYALKLGGAAIALLAAGIVAIWIFGELWVRIGIGAALVVVVGGLLFLAWRSDKRGREARAGLEDI